MRTAPLKALVVVVLATLPARTAEADSAAADGPFQVRARAVYFDPYQGNTVYISYLGNVSGDNANTKTYAEFSGEWYPARRWSSELAISVPTTFHDVSGSGYNMTLMTWTAKYHVLPEARFRPYVGIGAYYTPLSLEGRSAHESVQGSQSGFVPQMGVDVGFAEGWYLNADVRYLTSFQVQFFVSGNNTGNIKINPWLFSLGVSYRWH